jgi:predicted signal transduction protein with EAL and GGDEF domain
VTELIEKLMAGEQPRDRAQPQLSQGRRDDLVRVVSLLPARRAGRIVSILSFVQDVYPASGGGRLQYLATRDALTAAKPPAAAGAAGAGDRSGEAQRPRRRSLHRSRPVQNVNDTLGHRIGDELLKQVTTSLSGALRETDLLARLGGDEFMVIVEDFDDAAVLNRVAQKLQDAIAQPFQIEAHDIYVTSSIGISISPDASDDPRACSSTPTSRCTARRNWDAIPISFSDADLAARRLKQHTLESSLRTRSQECALELRFQPIVRIADRSIVGAEALLRWHDEEHGEIAPQVFIPLAEESGLIHILGDWVLKSAAEQCAAWRKAGLELTVSINLSGRQFYRDDLAQRISEIVRNAGCEPSWIELEVTESSLLHDLDAIRKVLQNCVTRASRWRSTISAPATPACRT